MRSVYRQCKRKSLEARREAVSTTLQRVRMRILLVILLGKATNITLNPENDPNTHELLLSCQVVSDSLQPRGLYVASLLCPWDVPGKNTGEKVKVLVTQSCATLCDPLDCSPPDPSVHGILQARILEWVLHFLLQGIFPTQGSNLHLLHCRWILYY